MHHSADLENVWKSFERKPEAATFEAFYTASRETAARVAWRALGDADWMEDAMQALYARLWQDRATRRIPVGITAREALIRWTLNECRTLNRRRARTAKREAPFEAAANHPAPGQAPDEAADQRMIAEAVRRLLGTLPDPYREALLACELEGATHAEAGNILGLSARTVQTHVRRGRDLLARKLRKAGITLPAGAALAIFAANTHAAINWVAAGDIIANASSTISVAGAISPSEGIGAGSLLTVPVMATAAACVAGIAMLVWVMASPLTSPFDGAQSDSPQSANAVAMATPDAADATDTRTDTDVAQTGTDTESGTAAAAGANQIEVAAIDSSNENAEEAQADAELMGETFSAMGRITSAATREGIPGATIGIMTYNLGVGLDELPRFSDTEITTHHDVVTNEDGSFTLEIPESDNTEVGFFLFARAEGYANQAVWFWPSVWEPMGEPTIEIPLPNEGVLAGRVEGPNGEPLSNVLVGFPILSPFEFAPVLERGYLNTAGSVTVTDSNGAFRLAGLPADQTLELPIIHEDWPPHFEPGVLVGAGPLTITVPSRGETILGTVTKGDSALAGWKVHFSQPDIDGVARFTQALASAKVATTDGDGRYEIRGILPGNYSASATFASHRSYEPSRVTIVSGHRDDVDFHISPPVMVELNFVALDTESGEPVAGVKLATSDFHMEIPGRRPALVTPADTVVTDAEGRAILSVTEDWITRGYVPETIFPTGYVAASGTYRSFTNKAEMFGHRFDPEETQTIELARGRVLEGTVLEVDGNPAAGAWISTDRDLVGVECDEHGRFNLTLGESASEVLIVRSSRGGAILHVSKDAAAEAVEIQLQPYGLLSGMFTDSTGRGIANAGIGLTWIDETHSLGSTSMAMSFTRRDGQFLMREIIPGNYALEISPEIQTSEVIPHDLRIEIAPGQSIHNFDITTTKGRTFEGVVTNADAEPLAGVTVHIHVKRAARDGRHVSRGMPTGKTEKDGYWKIENVPDGDVFNVSFTLAGYNSHVAAAENAVSLESPVNAMLEPLNEVAIRLTDATTEAPVPHYSYTFFRPGYTSPAAGFVNSPGTVVHNPQGMSPSWQESKGVIAVLVFELDEAGKRTGRTTFRQLDIGSGGEEQVLEVVIGESHRVTGRVLRAMSNPSHPIEGARITVGTFTHINHGLPIRKNPDIEDVLTGPDGTFTIELGPGLWELIASKGEHFSTRVTTVYVEDSPVNLEKPIELLALSAFAN